MLDRRLILVLVAGALSAADIPRTAGGHPDLSGVYDIATLTPLERPRQYGDRLTLTEAEANAIADRTAGRRARSNQASDPERSPPPVGGDGSTAAAGNVGGYNSFWTDYGSTMTEIDGIWRTSIITEPANGRYPEFTAAGKMRFRRLISRLHENVGRAWWVEQGLDPGPYDDPELRPVAERCLLGFRSAAGPPALPVLYNNLKQIVQTDEHVMILNEMVHDARIIRMDAEHEPPDIRRWLGDSVGRWDGDTLVVDTTNFKDTTGLEYASRELHVIERFTRIDAERLLYQFEIEDPATWQSNWKGEYVWPATDARIYEYACHEGNYSFGGILRGARLLEKEALANQKEE